MVGTRGTLQQCRTKIHHVPLLYCPVCHRVEVHHLVESEYEILMEYARGEALTEIDFMEYVDENYLDDIYVNCVNHEYEAPRDIVRNQIDSALDLLLFAKQIKDTTWEKQLKERLHVLSERNKKLQQKVLDRKVR